MTLFKIEEPSPRHTYRHASLHDTLELGLRPMYLCAAAWAIAGVGCWVFAPQWLPGMLTGLFWHAHEMLWGFVAAVAVGFLLTAVGNWTNLPPLQGRVLGLLALLWLAARAGFLLPGRGSFVLACGTTLGFWLLAIGTIARSLCQARSRNNYGFVVLLLAMALADAAFLRAIWRGADYAALMEHLFTGMLCMLVMALLLARRVTPFFASRAVADLALPRHTRSGQWQVALTIAAILAWRLAFPAAAAVLFGLAGLITLWHLLAWKPWAVLRVPLLWILYLGYLGLGLGLFATGLYVLGLIPALSWPVHLIAVTGFGPLILGMMTRTALGHTGRLLRTDAVMCSSFALLLPAIVLRVLALPGGTGQFVWLHASAACWVAAFLLYLYRFIPILTSPRADRQPGRPVPLRRG